MISVRSIIAALSLLIIAFTGPASAAAPVLVGIQSQQLPNGHTRVLLQFNGQVSMRPSTTAPTTNYVLQVSGASASPNVPTLESVNVGNVQTVALQQFGTTLTITFALTTPVRPIISTSPGGVYVVDVPPSPGQQSPFGSPQGYATPTPAPSATTQLTKMIRLRYADVSEVVGILTNQSGQIAPSSVFNPQPSNVGVQQGGFGQNGVAQGGFGQGGFQGGLWT